MAQAIGYPHVIRIAREVFPGLTDDHFTVKGDGEIGWTVTFRFMRMVGFLISCTAGAGAVPTGTSGHLNDVRIKTITDEATLRRYLEAHRDSLAKHLATELAVVLGPVRVLPVDEGIDHWLIGNLVPKHGVASGSTVGVFLDTYAEIAHRDARTAKPAGS